MFYILLFTVLLTPSSLFSVNFTVDLDLLSKDPTWLKLIHFDSSKDKRAAIGPKFLGYLAIFALFAWLWKAKIWRDVH